MMWEKMRTVLAKRFHSRFFEKMTDDEENRQLLASVRYGEKSLLTVSQEGTLVQVIDRGDAFLFVRVGDGHYITDFESIPDKILSGKGNFAVAKKDISSVDIGVSYDESAGGENLLEYAEVRLRYTVKVKSKCGRKTARRFLSLVLTDEIEREKLAAFFDGAFRLRIMPEEDFDLQNGHILTSGEVELRKRLMAVLIAVPVIGALLMFSPVFLPDGLVLRIILSVGALLPFVLFGMYVMFPRYLLIRRDSEHRWDETKWQRTIDMDLALMVTVVAQALLCMVCNQRLFPFPLDNLMRWAAVTALPLTVTAGIMLLTLKKQLDEWKERLYTALLCLIYVFAASFGAVFLLNGALDTAPPMTYSAVISEKRVEGAYRGGTDYIVRVVRGNGQTEEFSLFEEEYDSINQGDPVTIERHSGAFGISYQKVIIPD